MGQTLSHGVYLPNEGERNCYAGLASNWQILNTAVGAIAEKAPLVHTHGNITSDGKVGTTANLPLITGTGGAIQAGSFGNAANTFCEGNDSRLSDARTPVAHTHTKSDVTDLLNSNFIPSANNSYDLGSSSFQWNNLYAKKVNTQSVNERNPGALSLPDLNNGIDISSYITHLDKVVNNYTPSANGWLSIRVKKTSLVHASLMIYQIGGLLSSCETDEFNISGTNLPVIANQNVEIYIYADVLASAKFYPCQGNI